jgi:hypothetical protein
MSDELKLAIDWNEFVKNGAEIPGGQRDAARLTLLLWFKKADERIKSGAYPVKRDADSLAGAVNAADEAFSRLEGCIKALAETRPYLADEAWRAVNSLARASYVIGGLSEISESAVRRIDKMDRNRRPVYQNALKREKIDGPRTEALDAAILACVDGDRSKINSYEDRLNPTPEAVRAKMPAKFLVGGWPKTSTIRTRFMVLKKSR